MEKRSIAKVTGEASNSPNSSQLPSNAPVSLYLKNFLSQKRSCEDIPPPPEVEQRSDDYIRGFFENFSGPKRKHEHDGYEQPEDDEALGKVTKIRDVLSINVATTNLLVEKKDASKLKSSDLDASDDVIEIQYANSSLNSDKQPSPNIKAVKLANLPFKMSVKAMKSAFKERKVQFADLILDFEKQSGLPAGTAMLSFGSVEECTACFDKLKHVELMGRPLRVISLNQQDHTHRGKKNPNETRYFVQGIEGNITKKCAKCGQLGHIMKDCRNPALPQPCHLCAGADHDAYGCPNITCFRCGGFGHHVKDCRGRRVALSNGTTVQLCSVCGSTHHNASMCEAAVPVEEHSEINAQAVSCMKCGEFGHVLCKPMPQAKRAMYCPNCGQRDHHVDYPSEEYKGVKPRLCSAPRQEAYNKIPQLLHDIDNLPSRESMRNEYYARMARSDTGQSLAFLFPSLPGLPTNPHGGSQSNHNSHKHLRFSSGDAGYRDREFGDLQGLHEYIDYGHQYQHSDRKRHSLGGGSSQRGRAWPDQQHHRHSFGSSNNYAGGRVVYQGQSSAEKDSSRKRKRS